MGADATVRTALALGDGGVTRIACEWGVRTGPRHNRLDLRDAAVLQAIGLNLLDPARRATAATFPAMWRSD